MDNQKSNGNRNNRDQVSSNQNQGEPGRNSNQQRQPPRSTGGQTRR